MASDIDTLVLGTVNAPWRSCIDAETLVGCLTGRTAITSWEMHVRTFFEDVPLEAILRFVLAHRIPPDRLLMVYRGLIERDDGDERLESWLAELAASAG